MIVKAQPSSLSKLEKLRNSLNPKLYHLGVSAEDRQALGVFPQLDLPIITKLHALNYKAEAKQLVDHYGWKVIAGHLRYFSYPESQKYELLLDLLELEEDR